MIAHESVQPPSKIVYITIFRQGAQRLYIFYFPKEFWAINIMISTVDTTMEEIKYLTMAPAKEKSTVTELTSLP